MFQARLPYLYIILITAAIYRDYMRYRARHLRSSNPAALVEVINSHRTFNFVDNSLQASPFGFPATGPGRSVNDHLIIVQLTKVVAFGSEIGE